MFSMVIQIVWSFIHRIRIKMLLIIVGCGVAFGILSFLKGLGYPTPDSLKAFCIFGLQLLLGLTWFITYYSAEFSSKVGFPTYMYVLPTRTSILVSAQMLSGILTGMLIYFTVAGMAWILLGIKWPLLGPLFFLTIFLAWNMAIVWSAPGLSVVKAVPAIVIWGTLLVWIGRRYGIDSMPINPSKMWTNVTLGELLTMTLMGVGAYVIAIVSVSLDRCGDSPELTRIKKWFEKDVLIGRSRSESGFSGPVAAQMWFEINMRGHLIPIANVFFQLIILVVYLCGQHDGTGMIMLIIATVIVPVGCPFFAGILAGYCGSPHEPTQMDSFRAIRPMSSQALAHVMLRNGGLSVLLTWSGWLASFVLLVVFAHIKGHSREFFELVAGYYESIGLGLVVFIFFFVAILSWTTMASAASKAMDSRRWIHWLLRLGILAISLPLIYFHSKGMITPAQYIMLIKVFCCSVGLYCSVRTILAFYKARNKQLISDRMIGFAGSGWIVLCLASAYALWRLFNTGLRGDRPFPDFTPDYSFAFMVVFMLAALLMLPFAPLATAPLALAGSRSH
ncbi:hypothetical protein ACFL3Q_06355 [Planctomycetota bacterium]